MRNPKVRCLIVLITLSVILLSLSFAEENLAALVKKIEPSVVLITTYDKDGTAASQGTGFFINEHGDVITNRHVMLGANSAEVKTIDGKVYAIDKVLAEDTASDLIYLSSESLDLSDIFGDNTTTPLSICSTKLTKKQILENFINKNTTIPLSISSTTPEVGERVLVIGNPLGLEKTVSDGIISAIRDDSEYGKVIQITAPISPGSSGSPVINMKGEVIGISTFQYIKGQNLNFAIPAERIAKLKTSKGIALTEWKTDTFSVWLDSAEGLYYIGLTYYWIENYNNALTYFESAVKKKPDYANAYFYIGSCQVNLERYHEAIINYKTAIRINPNITAAHNNLGVAYGKLEQHDEALKCFKTAIQIDPDDAASHYNLGIEYGKLEQLDEAIKCFKTAIRIKPDYIEAYFNLGIEYGNLKQYNKAIEYFKTVIHMKADYANVHYNLGIIYCNLGQNTEAINCFKQEIQINPDYAEAHYRLGTEYAKAGQYIDAIKSFNTAIYCNPELVDAYYSIGVMYSQIGNIPEAVKYLKQAIRINPDDAGIHYTLGLMYVISGNTNSSLDEYKILKNLDKDKANKLFDSIYP